MTTATTRPAPRPTAGYDDLPELLGLMTGDGKHDAAAASTLDVLWVLYRDVLRVDPANPDDPERDRFLLSKGHGPMAYYAVLAAHGFLPREWLPTFGDFDSRLGHHPDRTLLPGVEIGSGSLGHGLGLGVGTALALRAQGRDRPRVVVLVGDGELDEGSNHEAIAFAGAAGLDSLTVVVLDNRSAAYPPARGLAGWFETAGWAVTEVDGRDHDALRSALTDRRQPDRRQPDRDEAGWSPGERRAPHVVVARVTGPRGAA
jgi:transketolase